MPTCNVIETVASVGVDITNLLRKGALADIHGEAGETNVQGEAQKKLDVIANDLLLKALTTNAHCAGVASEELDDATSANADGELLVLFDPLDGSSNIDINMPTGTIFSIFCPTKIKATQQQCRLFARKVLSSWHRAICYMVRPLCWRLLLMMMR